MLFKERQPFCLVTVLNIVACLEMGTQDLSGRVLAVCEFLPSLLPQGGLESPLGPGLFPRVLVHSPDFPSCVPLLICWAGHDLRKGCCED